MAKHIEQLKKYYFTDKQLGEGGLAFVYKKVFNPYLYYAELQKDEISQTDLEGLINAAQQFEHLPEAERDTIYASARADAQNAMDKELLNLLERKYMAVKVLSDLTQDSVKRFDKEIAFLSNPSIRHPHIVEGYGWIPPERPEDPPKLLMEYIDAIPLDEGKGKMAVAHATYICHAIAKALKFCHEFTDKETEKPTPILHRDIKPGNFLVEKSKGSSQAFKKIKLGDFGLVKSLDADVTSMTMQGSVMGTAKYYPPECIESIEKYNTASEVFSLGASLYEMLCGIAPVQSVMESSSDTSGFAPFVKLQQTQDFVFARELRPEISHPLENVVMMMVSKNQKERPTINEFLWMTERLLHSRLCVYQPKTEEEIEKRLAAVQQLYKTAEQNPGNYWNIGNLLIPLPEKQEEGIDALGKALEYYTTLPEDHPEQINASICYKLISVEKRRLNAPHKRESQNNINNQ